VGTSRSLRVLDLVNTVDEAAIRSRIQLQRNAGGVSWCIIMQQKHSHLAVLVACSSNSMLHVVHWHNMRL